MQARRLFPLSTRVQLHAHRHGALLGLARHICICQEGPSEKPSSHGPTCFAPRNAFNFLLGPALAHSNAAAIVAHSRSFSFLLLFDYFPCPSPRRPPPPRRLHAHVFAHKGTVVARSRHHLQPCNSPRACRRPRQNVFQRPPECHLGRGMQPAHFSSPSLV